MNKKTKIHPIIKIILALFIIYLALFIANLSGYYEGRVRNRVQLTNEKIMEFEKLVQNGEEVDIDSFIKQDNKDYRNKFSDFGEKLTLSIENIVKESMNIIGNVFKSLF